MKSNWMKLLILVVVAAMSLSLFACGDNPDETDTNAPDVTTEKKADQTTEKRDETTATESDSTAAGGESTTTTEGETGDTESTTGGNTETTTVGGTESTTESDTETTIDSSSETEEEPTETTTETDSETETAEPTETTTEMDTTPIEEIVAGNEVKADASYYFKLVIEKNGKELYLKGGMSTASGRSFALGVTENRAEAVQIRLETTEGGFYMYYIEKAVKVYINVVQSGNYTNSVLQSTPSSVWTFDTDLGTLVTSVGGKSYFLGTRNDKDYNDFVPCETQYTSNYKGQLTVVKTWDKKAGKYGIDCDHPYLATAEGHFKVACAYCGKGAGTPKDHEMADQTVVGDETTQIYFVCSTCGYTEAGPEYNNNINKYIAPEVIKATEHYNASATMVTDDDGHYVHFVVSSPAAHINIWSASGGGGSAKAFDANTGKYIVIKYRSSIAAATVFECGTNGMSSADASNGSSKTETWKVIVLDVAQFQKYQANTEEEDLTMQIRLTCYNGGTFDIAYVAIVDDFDEAKTLYETDDKVYYCTNWASQKMTELDADTGKCVACLTTETKNGQTYTYAKCSVCEKTFNAKTFPESVTAYWTAGDMSGAGQYNGIMQLFGDEDGTAYAHIASKNGNAYEYYFNGSKTATKNTGSFNYLVFKLRVSDSGCEFNVQLDGKNAFNVAAAAGTANEWVTVVVDTAKLVSSNEWADDKALTAWAYTNGKSVDIAYMVCCESWEDVQAVAGSEGDCKLITSRENAGGETQSLATAPTTPEA